jgi:hypothetical protein
MSIKRPIPLIEYWHRITVVVTNGFRLLRNGFEWHLFDKLLATSKLQARRITSTENYQFEAIPADLREVKCFCKSERVPPN